MDSKRRQQQLCVQALQHQSVGSSHGAPLGYLPSPWVMWDAGRFAEANRKRKQKKRMCTACLLAGVAVAVLGVAGVAGLAVYLGGTPPTESTTKWESFRRAGEDASHRLQNKHGILLRADPPERTTPPVRSPWAIGRGEGVKWEGRGSSPSPPTGNKQREEQKEFAYGEFEGVPEVEVVLDGREDDLTRDDARTKSARSPYARASEGQRPTIASLPQLQETSNSPEPLLSASQSSKAVPPSVEWNATLSNRSSEKDVRETKDEDDDGVRSRNHREREHGEETIEGERVEDDDESEEEEEGDGEWEEAGEEEDVSEESEEKEDESDEEVVEEEKDGREERRQQQSSNKVSMEGIPVFNMLTKILKRLNSSSNSNEGEVSVSNGTMDCSPSQFKCAAPNDGIVCLPTSSRCDGVKDCVLNGEDEVGCNCADTLRSRFLHRKICDGVPDCWDYSDEDQCAWCMPGNLVCGGGAKICVEPKQICDGVKDCPGGDDESQCIALYSGIEEEAKDNAPEARRVNVRGHGRHGSARGSDHVTASMITNEVLPYRSSGYILVRKKGVWGKLCLEQAEMGDDEQNINSGIYAWKASEIGYKVCKATTHRSFEILEEIVEEDENRDINSSVSITPYYQIEKGSNDADILESIQNIHTTDCSSKKVVRVTCKDLECGVRPKLRLNQWSRTQRIVGGGNAAPGAWPWQAALYREGEFQCGATLVSNQWLVSAGHCFFHARDDYWVARLGTLRRGTDLPSPYEQRRPVSSIILHPGYVDAGFLNDIALLRLSSPIEITDHVRPACLPPRPPINMKPFPIINKDIETTTSDEGISYDENITTDPSLVTTNEIPGTEFISEAPYTSSDSSDLIENSPVREIQWESNLDEESDFADLLDGISNSTSSKENDYYVEKISSEEKYPESYSQSTYPETIILEQNAEKFETSTHHSDSQRYRSTSVSSNINIIQNNQEKIKSDKNHRQQNHQEEDLMNATENKSINDHANSLRESKNVSSLENSSDSKYVNYSHNTRKDKISENKSVKYSVNKTSESNPVNTQEVKEKGTSVSSLSFSSSTLGVEDSGELIDQNMTFPKVKISNAPDPSIAEVNLKTEEHRSSTSSYFLPSATEAITPDISVDTDEEGSKDYYDRKARNIISDNETEDGIQNGRLCTVIGWGQLFEVGRIFPDTLQEVELPLISTSECRKRTLFLPLYHLTDAMFCAGYDRGGRDACLGDSGGPLMCQEPDGHWSLYGITSNGYGCARANRPGVYTKVSHYISWIEETIISEDAAHEKSKWEYEKKGKEWPGDEEEWSQWKEWRRRRGEEQGVSGKHSCPHRCPLGECLQRARICNGVVDCSDASDEQNCHGERNVGR